MLQNVIFIMLSWRQVKSASWIILSMSTDAEEWKKKKYKTLTVSPLNTKKFPVYLTPTFTKRKRSCIKIEMAFQTTSQVTQCVLAEYVSPGCFLLIHDTRRLGRLAITVGNVKKNSSSKFHDTFHTKQCSWDHKKIII